MRKSDSRSYQPPKVECWLRSLGVITPLCPYQAWNRRILCCPPSFPTTARKNRFVWVASNFGMGGATACGLGGVGEPLGSETVDMGLAFWAAICAAVTAAIAWAARRGQIGLGNRRVVKVKKSRAGREAREPWMISIA